eukprot:Colp12_sorted_trinity150504_noHs@5878
MDKGVVGDMVELGITESFKVKRQVLISAAEAAEMILRVDDIIRAPPRLVPFSFSFNQTHTKLIFLQETARGVNFSGFFCASFLFFYFNLYMVPAIKHLDLMALSADL